MHAKGKIPSLESLEPFDSCLTIGRILMPNLSVDLTVNAAISMMDRYRIAEALVHEHHARMEYPREDGNRRLLETVRGVPRLHPVWVIEPPRTPGRAAAEDLVAEMLSAGVKAARLPMKQIPPFVWLWDDLCSALEAHAVPAFLDFGAFSTCGSLTDTDVDGVRDLALAHPGLSLILSHVMGGLGVHPGVMHLMHRVDNLFMDIGGILEFWRVMAHEVGPHRILFATGTPFTDPGILIANIQYMIGFSAEEKKLMYGDNLRRLLKAVKTA